MTVIGKYNSATSAAFVIGNGTAENSRSDAFIVDWEGNVTAKKITESETPLTITGGDYISTVEDTTNNTLTIDLNSDLGNMLTALSAVLSANAVPTTGRHILGVENGALTWLEVNQ